MCGGYAPGRRSGHEESCSRGAAAKGLRNTAKLAQLPGIDRDDIPATAQAITAIAAALIETASATGTIQPSAEIGHLARIWHQLIH
jgi:hypothetical protein